MARRTFDPVGKCIYCGAVSFSVEDEEKRLSDEHIVALSLGGDMILPEASCRECARITSGLEQHLARGVFLAPRIQLGLPSRRKKKRPTHLPLDVPSLEGTTTTQVAIADYPGLLVTFLFPPPSILIGGDAAEVFTGRVSVSQLPGFQQNLERFPDRKVTWRLNLDASVYGRVIAKIAHAFAVAKFGIDGFRPTLPKYILESEPLKLGTYVGGDPISTDSPSEAFYEVSAEWEQWGNARLLMVRVRIFANRQASPVYLVVAGYPPISV